MPQFIQQLQVEDKYVRTRCNVNSNSLRHTDTAQYTLHVKRKHSVEGSALIRMYQNPSDNMNLFLLHTLWQKFSHVTDEDLQTRELLVNMCTTYENKEG